MTLRIKLFMETVMRVIIIVIMLSLSLGASTYYVAVNGLDSNDGSISHPWKTFGASITKLSAGDTLYFRGGVYYENPIDFQLSGTSADPIVILSYANENVEITGGVADFRDTSTNHWTLVDPTINLYKSIQAYGPQADMNAWLLDDDLHLITYSDSTYDSWNNLTSTTYGPIQGFNPIYVGPGIMLHPDGHLYIRLENNPNDLIDHNNNPIDPIPADIDPNTHSISVFFTKDLISVSFSENIIFKNITFSHARNLFDVESMTSNIEFDGCRFDYGRYAFKFRAGGAKDYEFHNCEFNNGLPPNVYWCDVKNRAVEVHEAYPEFQSRALDGEMPGFFIHDNLFRDSFDAISLSELTRDVKIMNNDFVRLLDDAISLGLVDNVEISNNLMWHVENGVSSNFKNDYSANNGQVYVHHNIIDFSAYQHGGREGNYRANHWPVWKIGDAFANHAEAYGAWWKVYNNTIIGAKSGYEWNPAGLPEELTGNENLYVYNNIFFVKDDRIIFRYHQFSSGAHYDGDIVFRLDAPEPRKFTLFRAFGDTNNYETLAEFQTNSGTTWEQNGLEVDPGFDLAVIENSDYEPGMMRNHYTPTNPQAFTSGVSYDGLDWPGTKGVNYRGAIPLTISNYVLVDVKIFLEGPYDAIGDTMRTDLTIPTTSPYSEDPRSVSTIPPNITDWVLVELRETATGPTVDSRSAFLDKTGRIVAVDGTTEQITMNAAEGSYYVVIKHRNHLAVMSANPVPLSSGSSTLYDFTTGTGQYYGSAAKLLETGAFGMYTGDANGNGQVQNDDKNIDWAGQVGSAGYLGADFNLNGQVQNDDKNVYWNANVGVGTQVPN